MLDSIIRLILAGFQPLIQDCRFGVLTIVPANVTQVDNRATLDFDSNTDNFTVKVGGLTRGAGTATGEQQVLFLYPRFGEDQNNADGTSSLLQLPYTFMARRRYW